MPSRVDTYCDAILAQNITGAVLAMCQVTELKSVLNMSFGDWEIFNMVLTKMRKHKHAGASSSRAGSQAPSKYRAASHEQASRREEQVAPISIQSEVKRPNLAENQV